MSDGSLPEKGPQDLLEAYRSSGCRNAWYWLARSRKRNLKRNAPQNRCRPEGDPVPAWCRDKELAELFSNCRLFVLPSHTEGLSLALLEAMSCGGRCLVSDIPANTVITKQYGAEFEAENSDSLAAAL